MLKSALFATSLSLLLLAGCNGDDNNADNAANDVDRGVEDAVDDTSDAIRDKKDRLKQIYICFSNSGAARGSQ